MYAIIGNTITYPGALSQLWLSKHSILIFNMYEFMFITKLQSSTFILNYSKLICVKDNLSYGHLII